METKNEQDIYLQGQIKRKNITRIRVCNENDKKRLNSYEHFVTIDQEQYIVCQGAFLSLHAIGRERLKQIQKLLISGKIPNDKRGTNVKSNVIDMETRDLLTFPVKESHYSRKKYKYLESRINVKIMYNLFKNKYPGTSVKYSFYIKFFHENFDLHFGRPQVDTCNIYEALNIQLRSPRLGDAEKKTAVAKKAIHCRRSKKFYNALQDSMEQCRQRNDLEAIAFDFIQNLQLPQIPVQELFYLTKLTVSVFCITNMKTKKSAFYIYHEGIAAKSPNEVCTFLMDYIETYISTDTKELHFFSDNSPGQNKNHYV